jgi:hypothetical protein
MTTDFLKRTVLVTLVMFMCNSFADTPSQPQPAKSHELYDGFSQNFFNQSLNQASDTVAPYGVVTGQDLIPAALGYLLLKQQPLADNKQYDAPFSFISYSANQDLPFILAGTPAQYYLGRMLPSQNTPTDSEIDAYAGSTEKVFAAMDSAALPPVSSSSSSYNSVGNVGNSSFVKTINQTYAAPYDSSSLFHYVPAPQPNLAGAQNPAEIYTALTSGALTPVSIPSGSSDDFRMQVRRIAAIQTAGTNALQQIFDRSQPVLNTADADSMKNTLKTLGDSSIDNSPTSERDFEEIMATHRLNPNNSWLSHVQQASPVELQRQALFLQAEELYELHQMRKEDEQIKMLLAVNLLSQNYQARQMLNVQGSMSPSAVKSLTANVTGTGAPPSPNP